MYHIELRQFPHNLNRFNLTAAELAAIVEPWAAEKFVEVGERKWSPHQARLTVLEGPELPVEKLAIGRGWKAALHESEDVTERVLAAADQVVAAEKAAELQRAAAEAGMLTPSAPAPIPPPAAPVEAVPEEIAALLGEDAARLLAEWRAAASRVPGLSPSETLALAEHAVRSSQASSG